MKSTFRIRPLQVAVMLALAGASSFSHALRLGEPVVKSYVGQPLVAEFAIEETTPEELRRLQIALANPSLYANMKAAFHPSLKTSSLAVLDRTGKTPKVVLRTDGPVEDSVVDIVFELTWAAGRMIQASTVLIDPAPAGVAVEAPAFVPAPVVVVEAAQPPLPPVAVAAPRPAPVETFERAESSTMVVQKGDTLSKIATRMNMQGVKLEQLLIALYNKNSKTIASKNMNLIREGTILALPTKQEALAVDASQAMKTVALHASNFRTYAQNLAQQSAGSTSVNKAPRSQTGSVNSEVIERQAPVAKDQVRIGSGAEGQTGGARNDKAPDIQFKNAEAENKSRQSALDKNLKDLEELTKLKNEQLAKMQQRVAPAPAPAASASTAGLTPPPEQNKNPVPVAPVSEPVAPASAAAAAPAAIVKPEAIIASGAKPRAELPKISATSSSLPNANQAPAASASIGPIVETPMLPDTLRPNNSISGPSSGIDSDKPFTETVKPKPPVPVAASAKVAPKEIKPAAPVVPPEEPSVLEDTWPLIAGGAGIAALLGGWLYARRKKKIEEAYEVEEESEHLQEASPTFALDFPHSEQGAALDGEVAHMQELREAQESSTRLSEALAQREVEPLDEELEVAAFLEDLPAPEEEYHAGPEVVSVQDSVPYVQTTYPDTVALDKIPTLEPLPLDTDFSLQSEEPLAAQPTPEGPGAFELPSFDLNFNPNESAELEELTRSLATDLPSLEEPTPASDNAAYAVSLTYDPDEQLGIAKFYLGLEDYRGVWDMVHPLLDHEREDVKAQAYELLSSIPDELRVQWTAEK